MARPEDTTLVCPRCRVRGPVALVDGEVCASCASALAWERHAGGKLVIGRDDIDAALRRTRAPKAPVRWRALLSVAAFGAGVAAVVAVFAQFRFRPLAPLATIFDGLTGAARAACGLGAASLLGGIAALVAARRVRSARHWAWTALAALAVGAGVVAGGLGGLHWAVIANRDWQHVSMPLLRTEEWTQAARIMRATTVVVAPDEDGDASAPAIGAGAVIHREAARAWIVTCSHVAMPYAAVASFRSAAGAADVWIYFSDGRNARGRVRWTAPPPLDVAVISVDIPDPPAPVAVKRTAGDLREGETVQFVPNPFRDGWLHERGRVSRRQTHATPAGEFSLVVSDLPLQAGDSGSGLFDGEARLVGLNTWRGIERSGPVGISLPSETLRAIVDLIESDDLARLEAPR